MRRGTLFLITPIAIVILYSNLLGQAKVIITEVADNTTTQYEYVELYNAGDASISIDGWILRERPSANNTTNRSLTLNSSSQLNTGGSNYLTLDVGEYALVFRGQVSSGSPEVSGFKSTYSIGDNTAIFALDPYNSTNTVPQMNGDERYQLEDGSSNIKDNFGLWNYVDATSFRLTATNCYERINGSSSDGQILTNWQQTARGSYTYTPGATNTTPLPVRLTSFNALVRNNLVNLKWTTATEIQNYGFEIERAQVTTTSPRNLRYAKIGFVRGSGTSNSPKEYSFVDNSRLYGVYSYRLKQVDIDGGYEYSDAVTVRIGTRPIAFDVKNYPNPFNPETNIRFELPNSGNVNLSIYNLLGEKVATLVDEYKEEGIYQEAFDARNLPSGVYFSVLQAGSSIIMKKMLLVK